MSKKNKEEKEITNPEVEQVETAVDPIAEKDAEIAALKEELQKEKDAYLLLMSDFTNFRRRTAQDNIELRSSASADVISGLLGILDDFEIAIKTVKEKVEDKSSLEGLELIYNKLLCYLKSKGLEVIPAKDQPFDTDFHEAVAQFPVPEEDRKGLVFDVAQTGYTLNGKVIRYAKVVVAI